MVTRCATRTVVAASGFLLGAVFALLVAPGESLVLIATGIVFGFCARALFDQNFGGDWSWHFGGPGGRQPLAAKPPRPSLVVHGAQIGRSPMERRCRT